MRRRILTVAALAVGIGLGLGVTGCSEDSPADSAAPKSDGFDPFAAMPDDLALAVIPRPQKDELTKETFALGSVAVMADDPESLGLGWADLLVSLGPSDLIEQLPMADWPTETASFNTFVAVGSKAWETLRASFPALPAPPSETLGEQHYQLHTIPGSEGEPNFILLMGGSPAAEYYGIQTLRQITWREGRDSLVRAGTVVDWPGFPMRGNKRFTGWMAQYKANLANQSKFFVNTQNAIPLVYSFREFHPISYPPRPPFDVVRVEETVRQMERSTPEPGSLRALHPITGLLMDDVEVTDAVSDEDRAEFGGYFQAIHAALTRSAEAVRAKNPAARVFFMPQFYFSHNRDFAEGGRLFRETGPFPEDVGIYFNGAEVSSLFYPREMVRDYLSNLGAPAGTPVLIYDTVFDTDKDFFPVPAIDPAISEFISGFVPESGNPLNLASYYDMLWNPGGYDRVRSGYLACRELMGFQHWELLHRASVAYQALIEQPPPGTPRETVLTSLRKNAADLQQAVAELSKLTEFDLTGRVDLSLFFERGTPRFFGPLQLGDFVIINRPFAADELTRLQADGPEFLPEDDVVMRVVFDNQAFPKLPGGSSWKARYVGPVNTGLGPAGRPVAAFPGFSGTGVLARLDQPLPRTDTWSVAFWLRATDPSRTVVPFAWYQSSDFTERTALALTPGHQPGQARQSYDRLRTAETNFPELGNVADGEWRHIAIEYAADGSVQIFLNGDPVGTATTGKPDFLEGDTLVLGAYPAPAAHFAGVRSILRNWEEFLDLLQRRAALVGERMADLETHYGAELAAPAVEKVDDAVFDPATASAFAPNERVRFSGQMTMQAIHDDNALLLRIRGPVPPQGFMPGVQIYIDPTPDRSGALQLNIPQLSKEQDPLRDFVQEGVGAEGDWAAWFARDLKPSQYKDLPVNWKWGRTVTDGIYEVDVWVSKDSLRQAIGGEPLPRHLGFQVYQWIAPWSLSLTWRGRIDPATYGTLELVSP